MKILIILIVALSGTCIYLDYEKTFMAGFRNGYIDGYSLACNMSDFPTSDQFDSKAYTKGYKEGNENGIYDCYNGK